MWTCIDTEAVQNQLALKHRRLSPSRGQQLSSQWRPEKTGAVAARKKTGAVAARKNGRGGGPKKRAHWRPEKTERQPGKTPRKPTRKPTRKPARKMARKRPEKTGPLVFVCCRGFPVFPGAPETSRKNGKPRFSRGQLHRFSGRADGFFQGALSAYVNGFFQDVFEASLGRGPVRPREGAAVGEVRADGRERQERQRRR